MKSRVVLIIMLIILGTFVAPLNNSNYSYGDSVLLYTVHQVAGSGDVNTDTLRKERCFVHVQIDVHSAHHDSFHRNNPDKTFYPGTHLTIPQQPGRKDAVPFGSHVPYNLHQTIQFQTVLTASRE